MAEEELSSPLSQPHGTDSSHMEENNEKDEPLSSKLTFLENKNLLLSFLAWACTISNLTLVVGTGPVVIIAVGGSPSLSSVPLGLFMLGASTVSLTVTPWIFTKYGRKIGFLVGVAFGLVGAGLGALSVTQESPLLNILANYFFGMSTGVGFFLRFAAVEVVPPHYSTSAASLVVAGGVVAAFCGPESARGTQNMFEDYMFLGTFVMAAIYAAANAMFVCFISFPDNRQAQMGPSAPVDRRRLFCWMRRRDFFVPALFSVVCWACMAMPMSMVRVAMREVGYTSRQSLHVMEWHFFGMYAPGFITAPLIRALGHPLWTCVLSVVLFVVSFLVMILSLKADEDGTMAPWLIGLLLVGAAWSIGFTAATVWISQFYANEALNFQGFLQSANESMMFAGAGAWVVSASYIYALREDPLNGFDLVCYVCCAILASGAVMLAWYYWDWRKMPLNYVEEGQKEGCGDADANDDGNNEEEDDEENDDRFEEESA